MSYEPTIWQTGDVITAEKLNKIEQALYELSGGGGDEPPAGYVTIAPEQSVTYSDVSVELEVVEGYEYPESLPTNLEVYINDVQATYSESHYYYAPINSNCFGFVELDRPLPYTIYFEDANGDPAPGTYTVAIYAPEENQ